MSQADKPADEAQKQKEEQATKKEMNLSFRRLVESLVRFSVQVLNIRDGVDQEGTIQGIKHDIDFRGPNVWILVCSIIICSIGLNLNSAAVVIGAMLISPLMGPILGVGLSISTYDWDTLVRSLKSLGVAVVVAIVSSWLYFTITPLKDLQYELLTRTRPTFLDVTVALFGGMAGIIAGSRKEKTNVVPGVAIATALMPPLCTSGYGLATQNWSFFFGAFYLFFLNSVFICASTLIVVRFLRFPLVQHLDKVREKRIKWYIALFAIIITIPSTIIFWSVIKDSRFKAKAEKFVSKEIAPHEGSEIVETRTKYADSMSTIEVFLIGEIIPATEERRIDTRMADYGLSNTRLKLYQAKDKSSELSGKLSQEIRAGVLEDIYKKSQEQLEDKDRQITFLENELVKYQQRNNIPFKNIEQEMKVQYEDIEKFAYSMSLESNFGQAPDTICTFLVRWKPSASAADRREEEKKLAKWLQLRLEVDTVRIVPY